jgi:hypothetical protein
LVVVVVATVVTVVVGACVTVVVGAWVVDVVVAAVVVVVVCASVVLVDVVLVDVVPEVVVVVSEDSDVSPRNPAPTESYASAVSPPRTATPPIAMAATSITTSEYSTSDAPRSELKFLMKCCPPVSVSS